MLNTACNRLFPADISLSLLITPLIYATGDKKGRPLRQRQMSSVKITTPSNVVWLCTENELAEEEMSAMC